MKIELRNVKYSEAASQETAFFSASVYIDGKRAGMVSNGGHGAGNTYSPRELEDAIEKHAKTLPDVTLTMGESTSVFPQSAEILIGGMLDRYLNELDLKHLLRRHIVYLKHGAIFKTTRMASQTIDAFKANPTKAIKEFGAEKVLNLIPFDEAVSVYMAHTKSA